jgi:hypothetical protein
MLFRGHRNVAGPGEADNANEGQRACGHDSHHGSCPDCQRAQLERWRAQLETVETADAG